MNREMKEIIFRPLRRIKKTGKIAVASYMQWRKVKTADYSQFMLLLVNDIQRFPPDQIVCNHKGEELFWFNHANPELLPKNYVTIEQISELLGIPIEYLEGEQWKISEPIGTGFHWSIRGFDCDGVPVFSHYTAKYIAKFWDDITQFEPLTVKTVILWYGWFLWELKNVNFTASRAPQEPPQPRI